jgi:hypothetical protein
MGFLDPELAELQREAVKQGEMKMLVKIYERVVRHPRGSITISELDDWLKREREKLDE